ncbi:ADP-ribose pyrophosphatase [Microbacterium aurum]|uniref:ADP-ribose pyrophosphatase n=1 Tax=Microbacterium aurum TaxID=36805 RepID=A0A1P8U719_9MICO|nr:NUDIX hydrolase N-terminal domain-containing protein [Microbacterium aurum]APZ33906.1 ADP-ribose pyrophosphatase [Microbacterium aurum]MBM7827667.1 ADP-ribose pyrophosphatase YjhB (NUDIX family) [Microbacterium aurum]
MDENPGDALRRIAIKLAAIAETGLGFADDPFDRGRYVDVGKLAHELMAAVCSRPLPAFDYEIALAAGYATPKVDVRAGIFDEEGNVLLVRESADHGLWTLPGGWADVLETPREAIEREVLEEAGAHVRAVHLAAVVDRERWPHTPAYDRHIYKLLFVCELLQPVSADFESNETSGIGWFSLDDLPPLSTARVLPEQIALLHRHWSQPAPAFLD